MKPKLVAGSKALEEFCLEIFSIPDPVIVIRKTELKPCFEQNDQQNIQSIEPIALFDKDNIHSMFFPYGFTSNDWNFVLLSHKEIKFLGSSISTTETIKGWMMGVDVCTQTIIGDKVLFTL